MMVDACSRVTGRKLVFVQSEHSMPNLTEEMRETMTEAAGLMSEWEYYGPSGRKDIEWTLNQLKQKPNSWEDFVRRIQRSTEGGWFP